VRTTTNRNKISSGREKALTTVQRKGGGRATGQGAGAPGKKKEGPVLKNDGPSQRAECAIPTGGGEEGTPRTGGKTQVLYSAD